MTDVEALDLYTASAFALMGLERPADQRVALAMCCHWAALKQFGVAEPKEWKRLMGGMDKDDWAVNWDLTPRMAAG